MKIREEELLDYMDGTLDDARRAAVEAHLAQDAELAALFAAMPHAMDALRDWNVGADGNASTRDLWPQIREQLPARAGSPLGRMLPRASWANSLFTAKSPWRVSARVAAIAVFVALGALLLSPRQTLNEVKADRLTPAEQVFIQQSAQRHAAYETVRSVNGTIVGSAAINADGRSSDGDGELDGDTSDTTYTP